MAPILVLIGLEVHVVAAQGVDPIHNRLIVRVCALKLPLLAIHICEREADILAIPVLNSVARIAFGCMLDPLRWATTLSELPNWHNLAKRGNLCHWQLFLSSGLARWNRPRAL